MAWVNPYWNDRPPARPHTHPPARPLVRLPSRPPVRPPTHPSARPPVRPPIFLPPVGGGVRERVAEPGCCGRRRVESDGGGERVGRGHRGCGPGPAEEGATSFLTGPPHPPRIMHGWEWGSGTYGHKDAWNYRSPSLHLFRTKSISERNFTS